MDFGLLHFEQRFANSGGPLKMFTNVMLLLENSLRAFHGVEVFFDLIVNPLSCKLGRRRFLVVLDLIVSKH
jgi:hypothetical protein